MKKSYSSMSFLFRFAVLLVFAINQAAFAQTFNVSSTQELRQALQDAAGNGASDVIQLADGAYKTNDDGGGAFTFLDDENYDLTIQGNTAENVILSGEDTDQVLNLVVINHTPSFHISNISVINGNSQTDGGGFYSGMNLNIENCVFNGNTAANRGGGFYSSGTVTITDSTISDNKAANGGGGFYSDGTTTVTGSKIIGNIAAGTENNDFGDVNGGGFYSWTVTINDSTISDNMAQNKGGGFCSNTTTITNSSISGNSAGSDGGGCFSYRAISITDSIITENNANRNGENRYFGNGGGFRLYHSDTVTITNSIISDNTAALDGGGFWSPGDTIKAITITDSTIFGNSAAKDGGGFWSNGHTITIKNSSISGNTAGSDGGGFKSFGTQTITNSIIANNMAEVAGGGFWSTGTTIKNSVVINNANNGVYINSGTGNYIINSMFINNEAYDFVGSSGVVATIYNNYIDETKVNIQSFKKNNIFDGNLDFIDQANGDFHIGENSDLIDAGTTDIEGIVFPATDLDGNPRISGARIDIGPYEFISTPYGIDFGDAPDPEYPTLLSSDGARHKIVPGYCLGSEIDSEPDGQPDATATGDDNDGNEDEDGVVFNSPIITGQSVDLTVTASASGILDAWVDFNNDGDWGDNGEQIFTSQALTPGENNLNFVVPVDADTENPIFVRFRFSSAGGLSPNGFAEDGEVEDYLIEILADSDGDGEPDITDLCPNDPNKVAPGVCGCGVADTDTDGDGTPDCNDNCPSDPNKTDPGTCGCGIPDTDSDGDGVPDCIDECPDDPDKTEPGICGCGVADTDSDGDGTADCNDECFLDPNKIVPGVCGCGANDVDSDGDGTLDCNDNCPSDPIKTEPGVCGCGISDTDTDEDGTPDCIDGCPDDPNKTEPEVCGCGVSDVDTDEDGTFDCNDNCLSDPNKVDPGICGCGVPDTDTDNDGTPDCNDECPNDVNKVTPGACGCGVADTDTDEDGISDCNDNCPSTVNPDQTDTDGDGIGDICDPISNIPGDINGDLTINLTDLVKVLQLCAGAEIINPINWAADVDGDNKIGMPEALFISKKIAGAIPDLECACIQSGGVVKTADCCDGIEDFPNLCWVGPCGCAPDGHNIVKICDCGPGKCFDGEKCVEIQTIINP